MTPARCRSRKRKFPILKRGLTHDCISFFAPDAGAEAGQVLAHRGALRPDSRLIFLPFYLLDGGFFHYAGDFNSQQISFYRYMNGFLKGAGYPAGYGGVKNTFSWGN